MDEKPNGFTIHELEALSGFDRRTIAYYSQEGLLPKVGRRGRGTVYPTAFKERLMFIRAVRNLQDAGVLRAVTLAEIRTLMTDLDTETLVQLQEASDSDSAIRALFTDPDWDTRDLAVTVEAVVGRGDADRKLPPSPASEEFPTTSMASRAGTRSADPRETSIRALVQQLEAAAMKADAVQDKASPALSRTLTVEWTPHISISVVGLGDEQAKLLLALTERLREMI